MKLQKFREYVNKKVELGLAQDIDKIVQNSESSWKSANKNVASILGNAARKAVTELRPLNRLIADLKSIKRDFDNDADKAGLDNATKKRYERKIDNALKALDRQVRYLERPIIEIRKDF